MESWNRNCCGIVESWNHVLIIVELLNYCGIVELLWNSGIMELLWWSRRWYHGIMESWNYLIMESWNHGISIIVE